MRLNFLNDQATEISPSLFDDLLDRLDLVHSPLQHESVELWITDDSSIQNLNRDYRGKDKPTDVLSFSFLEGNPDPSDPTNKSSLGQIIISLETAQCQAAELGQSLNEELRFLFTHGLLHLLGYDHETPAEEKIMLEKAYKILGRHEA
jgi:probable rRNA maturation factor